MLQACLITWKDNLTRSLNMVILPDNDNRQSPPAVGMKMKEPATNRQRLMPVFLFLQYLAYSTNDAEIFFFLKNQTKQNKKRQRLVMLQTKCRQSHLFFIFLFFHHKIWKGMTFKSQHQNEKKKKKQRKKRRKGHVVFEMAKDSLKCSACVSL